MRDLRARAEPVSSASGERGMRPPALRARRVHRSVASASAVVRFGYRPFQTRLSATRPPAGHRTPEPCEQKRANFEVIRRDRVSPVPASSRKGPPGRVVHQRTRMRSTPEPVRRRFAEALDRRPGFSSSIATKNPPRGPGKKSVMNDVLKPADEDLGYVADEGGFDSEAKDVVEASRLEKGASGGTPAVSSSGPLVGGSYLYKEVGDFFFR